jgi:hypothetical protein
MDMALNICSLLKNIGNASAKPMVGTHNIVLDGIKLGIVCTKMGDGGRWYLKKTPAGDRFLAENNIKLETGIKGNSYIIRVVWLHSGQFYFPTFDSQARKKAQRIQ